MSTLENNKMKFEKEYEGLLQLRNKASSLFVLADKTLLEAKQAFQRSQFVEYAILMDKYAEIRKSETESVDKLLEQLKSLLTQLGSE